MSLARQNQVIRSAAIPWRAKKGFVLFEIVLALSIFCIAAVALTSALHQTIDTVILLRDESQVRQDLSNILAESATLKLKPGTAAVPTGDGRIHYERQVDPVQAKTAKKQPVTNLIKVTIRATWNSHGQSRHEEAQVMMYQP